MTEQEITRYNLFITECQKVANAYGITLEQYFNLTINRKYFEFSNKVNLEQIFEWDERYRFFYKFLKEQNDK